jgi:hypothetical protein
VKNVKKKGAAAAAILALVAALIVAAYAAAPSGATQYSVTPGQFAALSAKVTKLQAQVSGMKKTVGALAAIVATCVDYKTLGVGKFGSPPSEGYVYQDASGSHVTSALDAAAPSSAPIFLLTTASQCATAIGTFSYRKLSAGSSGESGSAPSPRMLRAAFAAAAQR